MTQHFLIRKGYRVLDASGKLLGEGGDIIALETDAENREERAAADGLLKRAGGPNAVVLVDSPAPPTKKAKKKKGTYKTRDMKATTAPEEPTTEAPKEAPEEGEAG